MVILRKHLPFLVLMAVSLFEVSSLASAATEGHLPAFGRDTVLVWKMLNQDVSADFVVRIASFLPDRFIEWEDAATQGTIFMPNRAVMGAKGFVNARLFEAGVDTRSKDVTTLWLSQQAYRDLKEKKRIKLVLDSISTWMTLQGSDQLTVEVNRSQMVLPVIRVTDERESERWFLDQEENPLLVKHVIRKFSETLISITTDRPNALRWIKGKKLTDPH